MCETVQWQVNLLAMYSFQYKVTIQSSLSIRQFNMTFSSPILKSIGNELSNGVLWGKKNKKEEVSKAA